jgi:hypothetical protein
VASQELTITLSRSLPKPVNIATSMKALGHLFFSLSSRLRTALGIIPIVKPPLFLAPRATASITPVRPPHINQHSFLAISSPTLNANSSRCSGKGGSNSAEKSFVPTTAIIGLGAMLSNDISVISFELSHTPVDHFGTHFPQPILCLCRSVPSSVSLRYFTFLP